MIENVKEKLNDNDYKTILDEIASLHLGYTNLQDAKKHSYIRLSHKYEQINQRYNKLKNHFIALTVKHFNIQVCNDCSCLSDECYDSDYTEENEEET
jgi:hypothetical protein